MKKIIPLIFVTLLLSSCNNYKEINRTTQEFTIVKIDPPKRLYIDVVDDAERRYNNIYVAKRCGRWNEIKISSKVKLDSVQYIIGNDPTVHTKIVVRDPSDVCPR